MRDQIVLKVADFQGAAQHFSTGLDARAARIRLSLDRDESTRRLISSDNDVDVSWTKRRVVGGLRRRCKIEREARTEDGGWAINAVDRETGLSLVVLLTPAESGRREQIGYILFAAGFSGPNGWKVSSEQAGKVEDQFADDPILVYLDDGVLYIFAEPRMDLAFDRELFDGQLTYFLKAMNVVATILYGEA
ncbi:MAG: hypothetical protein KDA46_15335 [Parvularculaceae bacterium]|nr:hypothetical protein [Parvularculaceae bacterium]